MTNLDFVLMNSTLKLWYYLVKYYSLRPLISVFDLMYLDTKTCLDTSCQVLVVGGSIIFSKLKNATYFVQKIYTPVGITLSMSLYFLELFEIF
jgi:hypothetical protein